MDTPATPRRCTKHRPAKYWLGSLHSTPLHQRQQAIKLISRVVTFQAGRCSYCFIGTQQRSISQRRGTGKVIAAYVSVEQQFGVLRLFMAPPRDDMTDGRQSWRSRCQFLVDTLRQGPKLRVLMAATDSLVKVRELPPRIRSFRQFDLLIRDQSSH